MALVPLVTGDLTEATLGGNGVFDVLMRANKAHLESEFQKNRIKGPEYSQVYLGSLEHVLQGAIKFLLEKDTAILQAELIAAQVTLAGASLRKTEAEILLVAVEVQKANAELAILLANVNKIPAEIALLQAQAGLVTQQKSNAVIEATVLTAQKCKLEAEYDLLVEQRAKNAQETALLLQKVATEKAQTQGLGVDDNSVIGKQKKLYQAQAEGFARDAEQKAAKILADSWSVRRTTDSGTEANVDNKLNDLSVGRAMEKLLLGVSA